MLVEISNCFLIFIPFHNLDPLILANDDYFENSQAKEYSKASTDQETETAIKIEPVEEEFINLVDELDIDEPQTTIDDILLDDPLLPTFNSDSGDVNDILNNLEFFLSVCIFLINNS